jgi:hypothetical protein
MPLKSLTDSPLIIKPRCASFNETVAETDSLPVIGESAGDSSGYSVSSAGDVNGDGLDDLIVGAWSADPNSKLSV